VPQILKARKYSKGEESHSSVASDRKAPQKELVGVDVFLDWTSGSANDLGDTLSRVNGEGVKLTMISNRGVKVWPAGHTETFCSDHWRCRFLPESNGGKVVHAQVVALLGRIADAGYDFIKTEGLYTFDGERGFSLDQGE
jgi:isocitrate dehydrogenase